jgi:hypothetical protein
MDWCSRTKSTLGGGVFADATYRGFPIQDDVMILRILPTHVLFHGSEDQGHSWAHSAVAVTPTVPHSCTKEGALEE